MGDNFQVHLKRASIAIAATAATTKNCKNVWVCLWVYMGHRAKESAKHRALNDIIVAKWHTESYIKRVQHVHQSTAHTHTHTYLLTQKEWVRERYTHIPFLLSAVLAAYICRPSNSAAAAVAVFCYWCHVIILLPSDALFGRCYSYTQYTFSLSDVIGASTPTRLQYTCI